MPVPPGSGLGSGACLPSSLFFGSGACFPSSLFFLSAGQGFWSIMICWFLLVPAGVPVLVSLLLSSLVPVLVSLLLSSFFPQERGSAPSCFAGTSWFRLGFRGLSPFFSLLYFLSTGVLFHHDLLVPLSSGWGSGACLPSSLFILSLGKGFCFIMDFLVPLCSGGGSGVFFPPFFCQEKGSVPALISWFLLLRAGVPMLVSLLLTFFFRKGVLFLRGFPGSSCFGLGFWCLSPFFSFLLSFLNRSVPDSSMNFELHMTLVETCLVAVWGLCWCNFVRNQAGPNQIIPLKLGSKTFPEISSWMFKQQQSWVNWSITIRNYC